MTYIGLLDPKTNIWLVAIPLLRLLFSQPVKTSY